MKGAKDCVEAARNKILETVEDLESQVMIECHIEQVSFSEILLIFFFKFIIERKSDLAFVIIVQTFLQFFHFYPVL